MSRTAGQVDRRRLPCPGGALALCLHLPDGPGPWPCVVACHGLGASKDSDKYLLMAEELPRAGLALARFDFRGCGESSGVESDTTVATRIDDARAVLAHLETDRRLDGRVGLLGSSLGGFVALHLAASRADRPLVVTWNAPSDLEDLHESRDHPGLGGPFFGELATRAYVTTPAGVSRHLVIQAELDETVPATHGTRLYARAADPRELVIIAGADHRLTDLSHRRDALARSLDWFFRHMRGPDMAPHTPPTLGAARGTRTAPRYSESS